MFEVDNETCMERGRSLDRLLNISSARQIARRPLKVQIDQRQIAACNGPAGEEAGNEAGEERGSTSGGVLPFLARGRALAPMFLGADAEDDGAEGFILQLRERLHFRFFSLRTANVTSQTRVVGLLGLRRGLSRQWTGHPFVNIDSYSPDIVISLYDSALLRHDLDTTSVPERTKSSFFNGDAPRLDCPPPFPVYAGRPLPPFVIPSFHAPYSILRPYPHPSLPMLLLFLSLRYRPPAPSCVPRGEGGTTRWMAEVRAKQAKAASRRRRRRIDPTSHAMEHYGGDHWIKPHALTPSCLAVDYATAEIQAMTTRLLDGGKRRRRRARCVFEISWTEPPSPSLFLDTDLPRLDLRWRDAFPSSADRDDPDLTTLRRPQVRHRFRTGPRQH
ncbi:hypothetical protein DFH09DRAFT_1478076 [Mycena vulgaris]|nr:hypothetical protein DFH09DRAFT_1478076 [Mycena vulgaris]